MNTIDSVETVYALLKKNGGYITSKEAREKNVANKNLQRMTDSGLIERVAHGLYVDADVFPDPFFVAQYRCPRGVLSHETALFLHDLSDRVPITLMMTIPSGWNTPMLTDDDFLFFYCKPDRMGLGVCETETPSGLKVRAYDAERTLCDCLRSVNKLDRYLVITGLKQYIKGNKKDSVKLLEYAAELKIRDMVYRYLEVLT